MKSCFTILLLVAFASIGSGASITWADWNNQSANLVTGVMGGVNVTYTGAYTFAQISGGTNYWIPNAPYLSATVSNEPPAADIIAIATSGTRTISFSTPVTNPIMAIVSLNANSYVFDQPVTVLSFGTGYWGGGTLTANGNTLNSTGEGHGAIQFLGTFSSISWNATAAENWNGFTVGFDPNAGGGGVPEPGTFALLGGALTGLAILRKRRS